MTLPHSQASQARDGLNFRQSASPNVADSFSFFFFSVMDKDWGITNVHGISCTHYRKREKSGAFWQRAKSFSAEMT
jgi:hypothetical protein